MGPLNSVRVLFQAQWKKPPGCWALSNEQGVSSMSVHNVFQAYIVVLLSYTHMCCHAVISVFKISIMLPSDIIKAWVISQCLVMSQCLCCMATPTYYVNLHISCHHCFMLYQSALELHYYRYANNMNNWNFEHSFYNFLYLYHKCVSWVSFEGVNFYCLTVVLRYLCW